MPTTRHPETMCRHYLTLSSSDSCEANVVYEDLSNELNVRLSEVKAVCMGRMPGCPKYKAWTAEEIEKGDKWLETQLANVAVAREKVMEKAGGKRGVYGHFACPICIDHVLQWSVADFDSTKTAGKCDNLECVSWREYQTKL